MLPNKSEQQKTARPNTVTNYKTKIRSFILTALRDTHAPLSSFDLHRRARESSIDCDRSTIYRQLEKLKKENLISELDFLDGKKRYELFTGSSHHHLICTTCSKSFCIEVNEESLLALANKPVSELQFKIERHIVEFFGECVNCQKVLN